MKRFFLGLAAAVALFIGANLNPASAATILVDPNPTDSFHVGNFFPAFDPGYHDDYVFQLTKNANLTSNSIVSGGLTFSLGVFNSLNQLVTTTLIAGEIYTLIVSGSAGAFSGYGGDVTFTQAGVVPLPGALLFFGTALAGLGALGYRRKKMLPTA